MLRIELTPVVDFGALGVRWRALEGEADGGFFRSWAFLGCNVEQRFAGALLLEVRLEGRDVALALVGRAAKRLWLNETGEAVADSVFIEHNGLLVRRGHFSVVAPALREVAARAGALVLSGIDDATLRAARSVGWVEVVQTRFAPCVDVSGLGGPFLETLSANARAQIRRALRLYGEAVRLERPGSLAEAFVWFEEMVALHQAAWRRRGKPGAFAEPSVMAFHRALLERCWGNGEAELLRVAAGARHIGTLYVFMRSGCVYSYQSGFVFDADPRLKPGLVCHALAIAHFAERDVSRYDLLAGADRYKLTLARGGEDLHWAVLHRSSGRKVCSFLKKRTKKLLLLCARWLEVRDSEQKFFASFFQKRSSFFWGSRR